MFNIHVSNKTGITLLEARKPDEVPALITIEHCDGLLGLSVLHVVGGRFTTLDQQEFAILCHQGGNEPREDLWLITRSMDHYWVWKLSWYGGNYHEDAYNQFVQYGGWPSLTGAGGAGQVAPHERHGWRVR